ncbi:GNAT family N-acetyltransferase [Rhodococcoides yunnanense]|uniref:GNAT family N-acetyltransferase n=1 Tax=Rhodococcoides yunnanense TaxID=278209 RepID=UPI0009351D87|nr:GNAT family N-acetyltransferase [Rhodococcus yunnanensis]
MTVTVSAAGLWEAEQIADVAAVTFPLACPPGSSRESIESFIDDVLSHSRFGDYLSDPTRTILAAREDDSIVGYAMLIHGDPVDPAISSVLAHSPTMELSKMYVMPGHHGSGVSAELMRAASACAVDAGCAGMWLGVNQYNSRAQRFYAKHGFAVVGTKTFTVGAETHDDFVMERAL